MRRVFDKSDGIYGSPKIHQALQREGIVVGENRIARLMQENGLRARCARIYRRHVRMDRFYASIKNEIKTLEATSTNQKWLKENGVIQSMNRKGVMNDNAQMESFFRQFKAERIHRNEYTTKKELRAVIIEYVEFYNQRRLHFSLDYLIPDKYEVTMA